MTAAPVWLCAPNCLRLQVPALSPSERPPLSDLPVATSGDKCLNCVDGDSAALLQFGLKPDAADGSVRCGSTARAHASCVILVFAVHILNSALADPGM